jgi:hypothetical protein
VTRHIREESLTHSLEEGGPAARQTPKERPQGNRRAFLQQGRIMHSRKLSQLSLEMAHRPEIRIIPIKKAQGAL